MFCQFPKKYHVLLIFFCKICCNPDNYTFSFTVFSIILILHFSITYFIFRFYFFVLLTIALTLLFAVNFMLQHEVLMSLI